MFLADGAVIDPISGSVVPDAGKTSVTAISGITNNTIFPASADTYCLPCVVTGDMTGVEYSFKVNGQPAVTKTGKNYMPGDCGSTRHLIRLRCTYHGMRPPLPGGVKPAGQRGEEQNPELLHPPGKRRAKK